MTSRRQVERPEPGRRDEASSPSKVQASPAPHPEPRTLADLIDNAAAARDLSMRQLAVQARSAGYRIVDTTLNAIRNGTYKSQPREETVRAIGWLAGVSDEVAFTVAGLRVPGPPFADELPPGVDNLSPEARRVIIDLIRVLISAENVDDQG